MKSRRLAAASSACGPCEMGAATEPLDGRAFTVVVDARAGEGAGNSAASLHRSPWCFSPLFLRFSGDLSGGVGEKVKKRRRFAAFLDRSERCTAAGETAGRGQDEGCRRRSCWAAVQAGGGCRGFGRAAAGRSRLAAAGTVRSCGWRRKMKGVRVSGL
jgi:hypothetical protein